MLLNTLQCTGQPPTTKNCWSKISAVLLLRNLGYTKTVMRGWVSPKVSVRPNKEMRQEQPYVKAEDGEAAEVQGQRVVSKCYSLSGVGFKEKVLWGPY